MNWTQNENKYMFFRVEKKLNAKDRESDISPYAYNSSKTNNTHFEWACEMLRKQKKNHWQKRAAKQTGNENGWASSPSSESHIKFGDVQIISWMLYWISGQDNSFDERLPNSKEQM